MRRKILQLLTRWTLRAPSKTARVLAVAGGIVFFAGLVPWLLFTATAALVGSWPSLLPRGLELAFAVLCALDGLCLMFWAAATLWQEGRGTPNPMAPTQQLVVSGPYRHCRNPIQLGAIFYYLGVGTMFESIVVGFTMFLLAWVFSSIYHKVIEEKELVQRFGPAYEEYRRRTPFLFPRVRRGG